MVGIPSWPKLLLPHVKSRPLLSKAIVKSIPHSTFTIFFSGSGWGDPSPCLPNLFFPHVYTVPSVEIAAECSDEQATCRMLDKFSIFLMTIYVLFFSVSFVPIVLNLFYFYWLPQMYTSPSWLTAQTCWYPQLTCSIFFSIWTYLGTRMLIWPMWPSRPFRPLPHVYNLPSEVTPAEHALLALISLNRIFVISVGTEILFSMPMPS